MVISRSTGSRADGFKARFNSYLSEFGTKVTLNKVTETLDSQDRVIDTSTSSSTIPADIQYVTKHDLLHLNIGEAEIGDGMLFTKVAADVSLEDNVVFNDVKWRIISQIEGELVTGKVVYKGYIIRRNA